MVAASVLVAIVLQRLLVSSQLGLLQRKWVLAAANFRERSGTGCLECLIGSVSGLEVHPVLCGATELLFFELGLVTDTLRLRHEFVIGCAQSNRQGHDESSARKVEK